MDLGRIAFLAGLVISVVAGFINIPGAVWVLVVLGVVVGFINVTGKEVGQFLLAAVALILVGMAGISLGVQLVNNVLMHFIAFVAGATLVVALKEVWTITKDK